MDIKQINSIAWKGVAASGTPRVFRRKYRENVYALSRKYANLDHERKKREAQSGVIDTEPWPFSDPKFCPWPENDSEEAYSLFPNPAGFVTGHQTAYVSAMIAQTTGRWPLIRDMNECKNREHAKLAQKFWIEAPHRFDAKNWVSFLALNGYTAQTRTPENGHHYVGIKPDAGEFGLIVWFWRLTGDGNSLVSTRENKIFRVMEVKNSEFDWVEIPAAKPKANAKPQAH